MSAEMQGTILQLVFRLGTPYLTYGAYRIIKNTDKRGGIGSINLMGQLNLIIGAITFLVSIVGFVQGITDVIRLML